MDRTAPTGGQPPPKRLKVEDDDSSYQVLPYLQSIFLHSKNTVFNLTNVRIIKMLSDTPESVARVIANTLAGNVSPCTYRVILKMPPTTVHKIHKHAFGTRTLNF